MVLKWSRGDTVLLPRFRSFGKSKNGNLVIFPFCDRSLGLVLAPPRLY